MQESGSYRPIFVAFRLMSSTAVVTILSGAATNKIIALVAGLEGIALMGLYRNLGALISRPLALGFDTILVQRISTAPTRRELSDLLGLAVWLLGFQALAALLIGFWFAGPLARWTFGSDSFGAHVVEVRIVVAMAFVNLALQMVTAILSGRGGLRRVAVIGVAATLATLVLIYPLLRLGRVGLALNVGSGSLIGAAVGAILVWRLDRANLDVPSLSQSWRLFRRTFSSSMYMTVQPVLIMLGLLTVQSLVNGRYGLAGLGVYNAAMAVIDTFIMVLMAAVRSYYFPALGRIEDPGRKQAFMARVLGALLIVTIPAAAVLTLAARPIFTLLFSTKFHAAADLFAASSLSLIGQVFVWFYNSYLMHRARFRLVFLLDVAWTVNFVGCVFACTRLGLPLVSVAWSFAFSYTLSGATYAVVCVGLFGREVLARREAGTGLLAFASVGAGYGVFRLDSRPAEALYLVLLGVVLFALSKWLNLGAR